MRAIFQKYRTKLIGAAVIVLLVASGFLAGRYSTPTPPTKVIEKEKVVEKSVAKEGATEKQHETAQAGATEDRRRQKVVYRTRVVVKRPDGTVESHTNENITDASSTQAVRVEYRDRIVEKEKTVTQTVDRVVEKVKVIDYKGPDWSVGLLVGVDAMTLVGDAPRGIPVVAQALAPAVIGVQAERRILGRERALWLELWGLTNGTAGLGVKFQF